MTLVVINFDEHQFLIICIAMLIASALTWAITWPWARHSGITETNAHWINHEERERQVRQAMGGDHAADDL